jgi:hypothetical protein
VCFGRKICNLNLFGIKKGLRNLEGVLKGRGRGIK